MNSIWEDECRRLFDLLILALGENVFIFHLVNNKFEIQYFQGGDYLENYYNKS